MIAPEPPWRESWTGLSAVIDLPLPDKPGKEASATLSVGLTGTNGFDLALFPQGEGAWRKRILHATHGERFLVLEIPVRVDLPGLWEGFWASATNSFCREDWAPDASGPPEPGDEEAWGVGFFPGFVSRAAEAGLARIWHCGFDSRESYHDGRAWSPGRPDRSDSPGWRLVLMADGGAPARPLVATLFVGRDDGRSFSPAEWNNRGILRYRTADGRFFVLGHDHAAVDDPFWDDILELVAPGPNRVKIAYGIPSVPTSELPKVVAKKRTPAPAGPVPEKMKRIVVPFVDFHAVPLAEALEALSEASKEFDETDAPAAERGVDIVVGVPEDRRTMLPVVGLTAKSISVFYALELISEMNDLEWCVEGNAVKVVPVNPLPPSVHPEP